MRTRWTNFVMLVASLLLMAGTIQLQFTFSRALKEQYETTEEILWFSIILGIGLHMGLFLTALRTSYSKSEKAILAVLMAPMMIILFIIIGEGIIDALMQGRWPKPFQLVALLAAFVYCVAYNKLRQSTETQ